MEDQKNIGSDREGMSGQQLAQLNVAAAHAYVAGLRERDGQIPLRAGRPNWTAIALACGFGRGVFYDNAEARAVIERAINHEILTPELSGEPATPTEGRAAHLQKQLEKAESQKHRLEEHSAVIAAENAALRQENKKLRERLRQLSVFEEVMSSSGKRFIP